MGTSTSRRKTVTIILGSVFLVLLCAFTAMNAFNNFLNPTTTGETIVFIGINFVAFLLIVVVLVLHVRNVLQLYADQRSRLMGSRLRTRMLWGAVLVSLIPIVFMFLFSYGLMNRAVDRWFSQNPNEMRNDSSRLALELAQYTSTNARAEAQSIAASLPAPAPSSALPPGAHATAHSSPAPNPLTNADLAAAENRKIASSNIGPSPYPW